MNISARNHLSGTIVEIKNGIITSEVVMDVGGNTLAAVITKDSVDGMGLKEGDNVSAVIKSTSVMIMK